MLLDIRSSRAWHLYWHGWYYLLVDVFVSHHDRDGGAVHAHSPGHGCSMCNDRAILMRRADAVSRAFVSRGMRDRNGRDTHSDNSYYYIAPLISPRAPMARPVWMVHNTGSTLRLLQGARDGPSRSPVAAGAMTNVGHHRCQNYCIPTVYFQLFTFPASA